MLDSSITDGIIVVAPSATTFNTVSPIVVIDPNNENPDYPAVIARNRDGALAAMQYLTRLGTSGLDSLAVAPSYKAPSSACKATKMDYARLTYPWSLN